MRGELGQFGHLLVGRGGVVVLVGILLIAIGRAVPGGRLPGVIAVTRGPATYPSRSLPRSCRVSS